MDATICEAVGGSLLAYLDPGTGSLVFQMVIASAVSVVMTVASVRRAIVTLIGSIFSRRPRSKPEAQATIPVAHPQNKSRRAA